MGVTPMASEVEMLEWEARLDVTATEIVPYWNPPVAGHIDAEGIDL